jgi:DNA repair protein RecO (recombination protein O)
VPGASYATEAIVLRTFRTGEADRVVHLLTPGHGRVGAIAKGARKTTSRLGARLEPLTRIEAVLAPGRGELAVITSADVLASADPVRADPVRALAASAGIEAVVRLFPEPEPDERLYLGLARFLEALAGDLGDDPRAAADALALAFALKLLALAGWRPEVAACAGCGGEPAAYDAAQGCAVCPDCGAGWPLGPEAARWTARLLAEPLSPALVPDPEARAVIARVVRETAAEHGDVRLALLSRTGRG